MDLNQLSYIAQILKNQDTEELFFGTTLKTEDLMDLFYEARDAGEERHVQIITTTTIANTRVLVLDISGIEVIVREKKAPIGETVQFSQN